MTRSRLLLLGAITVVPAIWMVVWLGYFAYGFLSTGPWEAFDAMIAGMVADIVLTVALTVYYVRHALRNDRLVGDEPAVWTIFLIALNAFSQPVYWYRYIWRRADAIGPRSGPLTTPAEAGQWQQVGPEKP
jgi:hypothetical protein